MGAIRAMFSFFTMLRLDIDEEDMEAMDRSFHAIPLVGLSYGILAFVSMFLLSYVLDTFTSAALTLFLVSLTNRFLHMDGIMDVGDGLVVSGGRDDHLRALKDSRIGAGGVAFAVFVILLAVASWSTLAASGLSVAILLGEVYARNASVAAAAFGTPGPGMAGASVSHTNLRSLLKSILISVLLTAPVLAAAIGFGDWELIEATVVTVSMLLISTVSGRVIASVSDRNFGMVNGDVLGATNELTRVVLAISTLAVFTWMFW